MQAEPPNAREDAFHGIVAVAQALAHLVETSIGPAGSVKLLASANEQDSTVVLSKDGATIVQSVVIQHPAGALIVRAARALDAMVGDGTSCGVLLIGRLMREAQRLVARGIHCSGYFDASRVALQCAKRLRIPVLPYDIPTTAAELLDMLIAPREDILLQVAASVLGCKLDELQAESISRLCVQALQLVAGGMTVREMKEHRVNISDVVLVCVEDVAASEVFHGVVIDQGVRTVLSVVSPIVVQPPRHVLMPSSAINARMLLLAEDITTATKQEAFTHAQFRTAAQRTALAEAETRVVEQKVAAVLGTGANVVISCGSIDSYSLDLLARAGVMALRNVRRETLQQVSKAVGAPVVSSIHALQTVVAAAQAGDTHAQSRLAETVAVSPSVTVSEVHGAFFTRIAAHEKARIASLLLRSGAAMSLAAMQAAVIDALSSLRNCYEDVFVLPGAGAIHVAMAADVRKAAKLLQDKSSARVYLSLARSLESVPEVIATNSGYDGHAVVDQLRGCVETQPDVGVDIETGGCCNVREKGIYDCYRTIVQTLQSAIDCVSLLLRIDAVVRATDMRDIASAQHRKYEAMVASGTAVSEQGPPRYRRPKPKMSKDEWTKEDRERHDRAEQRFYSKEQQQRRQRIEEKFALQAPIDAERRERDRRVQDEMTRRKHAAQTSDFTATF